MEPLIHDTRFCRAYGAIYYRLDIRVFHSTLREREVNCGSQTTRTAVQISLSKDFVPTSYGSGSQIAYPNKRRRCFGGSSDIMTRQQVAYQNHSDLGSARRS